jgi:hypothetical protein
MRSFFSNWNFFRILRLVVGIGILAYGYTIMDWLLIMIGATLAIMSLANAGCSPFSNSCAVDIQEEKKETQS